MRRLVIKLILLCVLVALFVLAGRSRYGRALLASKSHFVATEAHADVLAEPGSESRAELIGAELPAAVEDIEAFFGTSFRKPFRVYVCDEIASFNTYLGDPPTGRAHGASVLGNVYISPLAFEVGAAYTVPELLRHELSHLHVYQHVGHLRALRLPLWFQEGVPNVASKGSALGPDDRAAVGAILSGYEMGLDARGVFGRTTAEDRRVDHMSYHAQSRLLVGHMLERDPEAFRAFLSAVESGEPVDGALEGHLGADVHALWDELVESLAVGM